MPVSTSAGVRKVPMPSRVGTPVALPEHLLGRRVAASTSEGKASRLVSGLTPRPACASDGQMADRLAEAGLRAASSGVSPI